MADSLSIIFGQANGKDMSAELVDWYWCMVGLDQGEDKGDEMVDLGSWLDYPKVKALEMSWLT